MTKFKEFLQNNKKLFIGFGAGIAVAAAGIVCFVIFGLPGEKTVDEDAGEAVAAVSDESDIDPAALSEESKAPSSDTVEESEDSEEDPLSTHLYVCVPVDKMHLRAEPGADAEEIATMKAGDMVTWDGESAYSGGTEYYKVKFLQRDTEGYANSDYLVPVYYEYTSASGVVETDNALYTYEMMSNDIASLCDKYPDILSSETIGTSVDGRQLYCMYLGNRNAVHHVLVQATIHGREYMNTQLIMRLVEYYASECKTALIANRTYAELLDQVCFVIVPMINPDGVSIAQFGIDSIEDEMSHAIFENAYMIDSQNLVQGVDELQDTYWEDNYRNSSFNRALYPDIPLIDVNEYSKLWKSNAHGVDLNNNFDADWAQMSLKTWNSYGSYKGDQCESEPETKALIKIAEKYDYDYYLSYHSKGNIVYYDTKGNSANVSAASEDLARLVGGHLRFPRYSNKTAANVNMGGFGDWVQLKLKKASVTIESGLHRCPMSIEEFEPMWLRHRELWAVIMNELAGSGRVSASKPSTEKSPDRDKDLAKEEKEEKDVKEEIQIPVKNVRASSELVVHSKDGSTYSPYNVTDSNMVTAWVEGVDGCGEGESITLEFDDVYDLTRLVIYNGFLKTKYRYTINGKITSVLIDTDSGDLITADIKTMNPGDLDERFDPDELCPTEIVFDEPVSTNHLSITIREAVGGTKYEDTAISEIKVYGTRH